VFVVTGFNPARLRGFTQQLPVQVYGKILPSYGKPLPHYGELLPPYGKPLP